MLLRDVSGHAGKRAMDGTLELEQSLTLDLLMAGAGSFREPHGGSK